MVCNILTVLMIEFQVKVSLLFLVENRSITFPILGTIFWRTYMSLVPFNIYETMVLLA